MLCDACGRNMAMPGSEASLIGIQMEVIVLETEDEPTRQWYVKQIAPLEVNRKYRICFPCWLRSLGVRPDCPVDSPVPGDPLIVY